MFKTLNPADWSAWTDGEQFAFDGGKPVEITVRAFGAAGVYLSRVYDAYTGEVVPLAAPVLLGSGSGEFSLHLAHAGGCDLTFVSASGHGGSFASKAKGHTLAPAAPDLDVYTVVKPRLTVSDEMRAMQAMIRRHQEWTIRQLSAHSNQAPALGDRDYARAPDLAPAPVEEAVSDANGAGVATDAAVST